MHSPDDELDELIRATDPTRDEVPPTRGSDRYRTIREHAMTSADHDTDVPNGSSPRSPRWLLGAAAAVLVLGVIGGAAVIGSLAGTEPADAPSITTTTVVDLGVITSFRAETTRSSDGGANTSRSTISFDDGDMDITSEGTYADGHTESARSIRVDGVEYETIDGVTTRRAIPAEQLAAPFDSSMRTVAKTLLANSDGSSVTETLDGVPMRRLQLFLDTATVGALQSLPPGVTGWFELEYPDQIDELTIWVSDDDVIHQIEFEAIAGTEPGSVSTTRVRFFDVNSDITITAPPGPYENVTEG